MITKTFFGLDTFSKILKISITFLVAINLIFSFLVHASTNDRNEKQFEPPQAGELRLFGDSTQANNRKQTIAPIIKTDVEILVSGLTARVSVSQIFKNDSNQWLEGKYLFPLPEKAAVDRLRIEIGDRIIVGKIKEKQQAKKIYQKAKLAGKKASLVEQQRPNLFTNSIANIAPFETIKIVIEYQQDINYHRERGFSLRFPMTITPRYQPNKIYHESFNRLNIEHQENNFQQFSSSLEEINVSNDQEFANRNLANISVILDSGMALKTLTSPSHKIQYQQKSEREYLVGFKEQVVIADRDFILNWQPIDSVKPRAALFSETKNNEHFVSLMIVPPSIDSSSSPDLIEIPREIIFVIDTSGSMSGTSMQQAIEALNFGLTTLNPKDKFNVIQFNSTTDKLFSRALLANQNNLAEAQQYINNLQADGGTEMFSAIDTALDGQANKGRLRQVIFLTDGAISNEAELFKLIDSKLAGSRLYTVGIGSAPNEFFMKKAARFGRGTFTFISDISQSKQKIESLFESISQPQLTHIDIQWPEVNSTEVWPNRIPDLYDGEPLWIKSKIGDLSGKINISGRLEQTLWQVDLALNSAQQQEGIAALWAREKISSIMNNGLHGKIDEKAKRLIIETALEHHLVSRYTSLIAVEETPSRQLEQLHKINIKNETPKGFVPAASSNQQVNFASTGLDLDIDLHNSLYLLLASIFSLIILRKFW